MEGAFAIVLFVVVGLAVVGAVVSLVMSGDTYSHIGRGGLSIGDDRPLPGSVSGQVSAAVAMTAEEREADIRSLLEARAARRVARGEPPGDVEAELAALLRDGSSSSSGGAGSPSPGGAAGPGGPSPGGAGSPSPPGGAGGPSPGVDPEIEAEVRQLVESRNARRVARGEEPLDVDAEVTRRLRDYGAM